MRLDIRYRTVFDYAMPVRESANELRACPASTERQQLLTYRVVTDPSARVLSSHDYWGNRVDTFTVRDPHTRLEILAESMVETLPAAQPTERPPLDVLGSEDLADTYAEYRGRSPHANWGESVAEAAAKLAAEADDVVALARSIHDFTASRLRYTPGVTEVGVAVDEVFTASEGVCQDFAHLAVSLARAAGLPARYVSGYLFTADDATGADVEGDLVTVQTHAWVEFAIPGWGWWALDPTNAQDVGERHVTIGHGRDYDDVVPLRGTFAGPPEHHLHVEVEMRRVASHQAQQQ